MPKTEKLHGILDSHRTGNRQKESVILISCGKNSCFSGRSRKAALVKIKRENRYAHPEDDFFLRCGEEAKFLSEDDLNGCERLVKDILRFVRQKFSYEEYRMFMLRFYEAQFSFKALAECMGISASAISQKVCRIVDAVRTHSGFAWRSQMLAVESFMY